MDTTLNKIVDSEAFFKNKIKAVKRAQNYREIFLYPILPGFLNGPEDLLRSGSDPNPGFFADPDPDSKNPDPHPSIRT